ncbi:MBL fold metallo-hydrolase [Deinococcus pimensis]|uniref:MBL fold metallo-hydrolase n=1 Tax=Deinococcus pimensis TaxID=309888 RepID=UPI00047F2614|nr:rhodanese-like domain-containing protein [Deinococcus pimensis]
MILETIRTEGLAALSYFLADTVEGVAAVIDPRRDVGVYLDLARAHGVRITDVFDTHVHADYLSGARELCTLTNAAVHVGPGAGLGFDAREHADGDLVRLGAFTLRVLHTPGHSPEHVSLVLSSGGHGAEGEWAVFTGDTLLNGEVGRPDLAESVDAEQGARQLFSSLRRLLALDDGLLVYPAHGHGSPCGGRIGVRDLTTIGYERVHNPLLSVEDEAEFTARLLAGLPPQPVYYARVKDLNTRGPGYLGTRPQVPWLDPRDFSEAIRHENAVVLDTREIEAWADAHVEGSLNIALRDAFPIWAGWMLAPRHDLYVILDSPDHERLVEEHLTRLGLEGVCGYLRGGMRAWVEAGLPIRSSHPMSVHDLRSALDAEDDLQLLDVRRDDEWQGGHLPRARHAFLGRLWQDLPGLSLDPERPLAVYCGSGYRSSMAASLLERQGFREVYNVLGSVTAWRAAGYPLEGQETEPARA